MPSVSEVASKLPKFTPFKGNEKDTMAHLNRQANDLGYHQKFTDAGINDPMQRNEAFAIRANEDGFDVARLMLSCFGNTGLKQTPVKRGPHSKVKRASRTIEEFETNAKDNPEAAATAIAKILKDKTVILNRVLDEAPLNETHATIEVWSSATQNRKHLSIPNKEYIVGEGGDPAEESRKRLAMIMDKLRLEYKPSDKPTSEAAE